MGSQHSKHRIACGAGGGAGAGRWADMEGPAFHCSYLGYQPLAKPPTGLQPLQAPVKDMYLRYRKSTAGSHSASLKLTQQGVFVLLFEDGAVKQELFLSFSSVNLVDAVKFYTIKSSNPKKPKAIFRSVDEGKPPLPDKHAFALDKNVLFLATASHPPLVVCVVRRPQGVKALDAHVFALDTVENAIHIASIISSTQQIPGHVVSPGSAMMATADSGGGFGGGGHGRSDVIHTEYGDYSVYRGPPAGYEQGGFRGPLGYESNVRGGAVGYEQGMPAGEQLYHGQTSPVVGSQNRDGFGDPVHQGHHMLRQDDFYRPQHAQTFVQPEPQVTKPPFSPENIGAFRYDVSGPDLLRGRQNMSSELREENGSHSNEMGTGVVMRTNFARNNDQRFSEDSSLRNSNQRFSSDNTNNHRMSSGPGPPVAAKPFSPRTSTDNHAISRYSSGGSVDYPKGQRFSSEVQQQSPDLISSQQHAISPVSPRLSDIARPTSPQSKSPVQDEFFSASNLEGRGDEDVPDVGAVAHDGRPIAKVPPHMKGIKVLPSDFKMVKLKHKEDNRQTDSQNDDADYDNNKHIMNRYRELQEQTRETYRNQAAPSVYNNYHEAQSPNYNRSSFNPQSQTGNTTSYATTSHNVSSTMNPHSSSSTKDAEIANMFSDFSIHGGGKGNPLHRQQRNDFEDGLGYLP